MAHFLIDAGLPRSTAEVIRSAGYECTDVRDIGMGSANDNEIAIHAKENGHCIITRDMDFGNVLDYPPRNYAGIVVLRTPYEASRSVVLSMIRSFLGHREIVGNIGKHLAIVEPGRIRVRSD